MDAAELLRRNIDTNFNELLSLAEDRERARILVDEIRQCYDILALPQVAKTSGRFHAYKMARDAIRAVLEEHGRPMTDAEIKDAVANDGGIQTGR